MRMFQGVMKPLARLMIVYMLGLGIQLPAAQAAMVSTQAAVSAQQLEDQRDRIRALFQRDDVRQALIQQGVDPAQAQQRVDQLTDAEVQQIAGKIDELPAGAGALEVVLIVVLVLVITELLGYTDIVNFDQN